MRADQDAMMLVRADLCERLERLRRLAAQRQQARCDDTIAGIRELARAYGLSPVVNVATALEQAMHRSDSAGPCQSALYLERLQDAIGCSRFDEEASAALIASVSVRFA